MHEQLMRSGNRDIESLRELPICPSRYSQTDQFSITRLVGRAAHDILLFDYDNFASDKTFEKTAKVISHPGFDTGLAKVADRLAAFEHGEHHAYLAVFTERLIGPDNLEFLIVLIFTCFAEFRHWLACLAFGWIFTNEILD